MLIGDSAKTSFVLDKNLFDGIVAMMGDRGWSLNSHTSDKSSATFTLGSGHIFVDVFPKTQEFEFTLFTKRMHKFSSGLMSPVGDRDFFNKKFALFDKEADLLAIGGAL